MVVELHRRVVPHAGHLALALADARGARARRPGARPTSGRACPTSGRASRRTSRRRPRACRDQQPVCAKRMVSNSTRPCLRTYCRGSSNAGIAPVPREVEGDRSAPVGSRTKRTASSALDAPRRGTVRRSCPSGRRARATRARRGGVPPRRHARERVLHAEVRVLAEPHDHEELVARGVQVEVVAVVEVPIARADVADRRRRSGGAGSRPSRRAWPAHTSRAVGRTTPRRLTDERQLTYVTDGDGPRHRRCSRVPQPHPPAARDPRPPLRRWRSPSSAAAASPRPRSSDIVRAAGVARGTFYLHFPTKDHVLMELLRRRQDTARPRAPRQARDGGPALSPPGRRPA